MAEGVGVEDDGACAGGRGGFGDVGFVAVERGGCSGGSAGCGAAAETVWAGHGGGCGEEVGRLWWGLLEG